MDVSWKGTLVSFVERYQKLHLVTVSLGNDRLGCASAGNGLDVRLILKVLDQEKVQTMGRCHHRGFRHWSGRLLFTGDLAPVKT